MKNKNKKSLGKGLSALFGEDNKTEKPSANSPLTKAPISNLNRNKYQPRINFDQDKLDELSKSIKNNGIIQPIAVRSDKNNPGSYEIIAGERRWLAAQKAGLHEVPITIMELDDSEVLEVAIVENIQREDLNVIEEAKGFERLKDEFGYDQERIAKLMGKSRSHISNTLRLLTLPSDVINMIQSNELTAGQARPLVGMPNASSIAEEIVSKKMSARSIEHIKRAKTKSYTIDPNIFDAQRDLERKLGLRVNIQKKKNNSGKITLEYKNTEQFEFISKLLKG